MSEQNENLRKAEASLQDAEKRLAMVRKWQPRLQQAVLEYHASIQRLKDLSATDVPNAATLARSDHRRDRSLSPRPAALGDRLEPDPAASRASPAMESIAMRAIEEDAASGRSPPHGRGRGRALQAPERSPTSRDHPDAPSIRPPGDTTCPTPRHSPDRTDWPSVSASCAISGWSPRSPGATRSASGSRSDTCAPLESAVDSAVNGIKSMAEILDQVRRDCSDRSELL